MLFRKGTVDCVSGEEGGATRFLWRVRVDGILDPLSTERGRTTTTTTGAGVKQSSLFNHEDSLAIRDDDSIVDHKKLAAVCRHTSIG